MWKMGGSTRNTGRAGVEMWMGIGTPAINATPRTNNRKVDYKNEQKMARGRH